MNNKIIVMSQNRFTLRKIKFNHLRFKVNNKNNKFSIFN